MSRTRQGQKRSVNRNSRVNAIVLLLVAAVVGYCVLLSVESKSGRQLMESIPGVRVIYDYLNDFGEQSRQFMDNAVAVSGRPDTSPGTVDGEGLSVHMLDVGQAECILIKAPDKNVLIDAGDNGQGAQVLRYLKDQGVDRLHIMIATHPHADHVGGMDEVIAGMPVDLIIMPDLPDALVPTTRTYSDLLNAVIDAEIETEAASVGALYDLGGGASLKILAPGIEFDDLNELSVMSKLTYGKNTFLFTGDAEKSSELDILTRGGLRADVLNVGHHGSSTSSSKEFLEAVRPSLALISCGIDNSYGHPHRSTVERLQSIGADILRTDLNGTVVIHSDGEKLSIHTEK